MTSFSPYALRAFELAFRPWMSRRLAAVRVTGIRPGVGAGRPLMLVANHTSWWDAFLLREVQRVLRPDAPILTVMLERELARLPLFRLLGAIGMNPDSPASVRGAIRGLREQVESDPRSTILFFPQGRIWPAHRRPLGFRPGVELFSRRLAPICVLPAGIHLEPLAAPAPTAFVALAEPIDVGAEGVPASVLERAMEDQLDRVLDLLAREGEGAADRWPAPADALPPVLARPRPEWARS
jgi:1-acyl-sn-glycerol-3-phosphate acyltransferase